MSKRLVVDTKSFLQMIVSRMGKRQMRGWMNHILGATGMLELRDEEQINSEIGLFLFGNETMLNVGLVLFAQLAHKLT